MRILLTTFTFPPQANGIAESAQAQAFGLAKRGHQVTVATDYDAQRSACSWPEKVEVREFNVRGWQNLRIGITGEVQQYQDFLVSHRADILFCNAWQNWATDLAILASPRLPTKKVLLSHGFNAHVWPRQKKCPWGLGQWLGGWPYVARLPQMLRAFDHVAFLSERCDRGRFFDHWLASRLMKIPSSVIPVGVWPDLLNQPQTSFRAQYGIQTPYLLLNVGNYCERKNQISALRTFLNLGRQDATLVFIGSEFNDYSDALQKAGRNLPTGDPAGRSRVLMLEKLPRTAIYAAYQAADILVLSALDETQPIVLLEAMSTSVPFVSTDVGCVKELAGGVVVANESAMARAINRLLDDVELRRQLGAQGRAAVHSHYSWDKIVARYETLFLGLLNSSRAAV
jgi:glycosyltransferase involved in cell wall biosynthesis